MDHGHIKAYYEERYGSRPEDAFPPDPGRYQAWFGTLLSSPPRDARFLDYGCGVGYVCSLFCELGYEVTGVDISPSALERAREREPRATFLESPDDATLPFGDRTFDVVACLGTIEHVPEPLPVIRELRRVAVDDAVGIWVVPNSRSPFFWLGHGTEQLEEHPRSLRAWRDLLAEGGWRVTGVERDPGPVERPIASWKRWAQAALNRLPVGLTYQFVLRTEAGPLPRPYSR